jgi:hypothetical protein
MTPIYAVCAFALIACGDDDDDCPVKCDSKGFSLSCEDGETSGTADCSDFLTQGGQVCSGTITYAITGKSYECKWTTDSATNSIKASCEGHGSCAYLTGSSDSSTQPSKTQEVNECDPASSAGPCSCLNGVVGEKVCVNGRVYCSCSSSPKVDAGGT